MTQQRKKGPRFYRTSKTARQSMAEIMALLSEFGAESFHVQQKDGEPAAIAFVFRGVAFQVEPSIAGLAERIKRNGVAVQRDAAAVARAQLRNLLELQLELVESAILTPESMFGGHALTSAGHTVGDMLRERNRELMPGERPLLAPGRPA